MKQLTNCLGLITLLVCASRRAETQVSPPAHLLGCEFSSGPKSSLSWESGMAEGVGPATPAGRDVIVGRVFAVRNGEPMAEARIRLDPGSRFAVSDSNGRFAFPAVPQGRYHVTVMSLGRGSVSDSVTLGFDGLRMVAALATYRGDIVCTVPSRKPSNGR